MIAKPAMSGLTCVGQYVRDCLNRVSSRGIILPINSQLLSHLRKALHALLRVPDNLSNATTGRCSGSILYTSFSSRKNTAARGIYAPIRGLVSWFSLP